MTYLLIVLSMLIPAGLIAGTLYALVARPRSPKDPEPMPDDTPSSTPTKPQPQAQPLSAAGHFREGERLLAESAGYRPESMQAYAARATAHFTAAQILMDAHTARSTFGLEESGMQALADSRRPSTYTAAY